MPLGRPDRHLCESQTRRRVGRALPVSRSRRRRREPERHPLQHHGDDPRRLPEWHAWLPGIDRSKVAVARVALFASGYDPSSPSHAAPAQPAHPCFIVPTAALAAGREPSD
jgi:hypothetical protein